MGKSTPSIALIGFDMETAKIFKLHGLNIVAHIYANQKNKKKRIKGSPDCINFNDWKSYTIPAEIAKPIPFELQLKIKNQCRDEFIRCTDRWPWSRELIQNWNDYDHLFRIACDYCYGWLLKYKPDVIIYSNTPHQGIGIIQYALARQLGIKTLIFMQTPFAGRSWLVEDWQDLGVFDTAQQGDEFDIDITPPTAPPFYMKNVQSSAKRKIRNLLLKLRARTITSFGLTGIGSETRRKNFQRNLHRWQNTVEDIRYAHEAKKFFKDKPANEPYVYFPLHLQPEMTTDVLGGTFGCLIHAIETLRKIVPSDIPIYVKENPKQTGKMRSCVFFQRLAKIANVKYIPYEISSFELIKNSAAVSTITGTAGWEALRMGKPVIVFGHIFWNQLPGAFHISTNPDWASVSSFKFEKTNLENACKKLGRFTHQAVCDMEYARLVENYNPVENDNQLASIIKMHTQEKPMADGSLFKNQLFPAQ